MFSRIKSTFENDFFEGVHAHVWRKRTRPTSGLTLKSFLVGKLDDAKTLASVAHSVYQLRKDQWKEISELRKIQLRKLRAIITYAYYNVPYYHRIFKTAGIKPEQIKNLEDLQKIPITTKSDVQTNTSKIISDNADLNKCTSSLTSGSTGRPLEVISGPEARYYSLALVQYAFFECGLRLRDKLVEMKVHPKSSESRLPIGLGFLGAIRISSRNPVEENIKLLKKIRPDALYSYTSVLWQLANEIKRKNITEIKPRLIFSHGEALPPRYMQLIYSTFGSSIHDMYGSTEFNRLAFQCNRHSGLHMITDGAVIEIIRDGENVDYGELGEIVVTGLYNYAMPLIRYRLGDVGAITDENCECGRSWPLIKRIEGRASDFSILPSGRAISPINLMYAIKAEDVKGVTRYQIIQEERSSFLVKVVVNQEFNREQIFMIQKRIQLCCLGEEINVEVRVVNKIPKDKTGKFRVVISRVGTKNPFN
jgi:phenylacetate-CoA ligase